MGSRFQALKRVELAFAGTGWEDAFVELSIPSYGEIRSLTQEDADAETSAVSMMEFLKDHFVSGKAPDGGQLVDLKAKDIDDLPLNVIQKLSTTLIGEEVLDPKAS